eukprot:Clim_evm8s29 gene=Clim_evmTU8s29
MGTKPKTFASKTLQKFQPTREQSNAVYFWGKKDEAYAAFSNFYRSASFRFTVDDFEYDCTERFFMMKKAAFFGDDEILQAMKDPRLAPLQVKRLGRKVQHFDVDRWSEASYGFMVDGLYHKFGQNEDLRVLLLDTGDRLIVEASPFDKLWGIGLGKNKALRRPIEEWPGKNLLGKALMEVREKIRGDQD